MRWKLKLAQGRELSHRVLQINGDIYAHESEHLLTIMASALERGAGSLIVDLARVKYMNEATINALIKGHDMFEQKDARLIVVCPQQLRYFLHLTGQGNFQVVDTVQDATEFLSNKTEEKVAAAWAKAES